MPVHKVNGGYRYGKSGKVYRGKGAKQKAQRQAGAIYASGYKGGEEMRKITLNVDDNAKVISVTTFSDFETYCNANTMAFDIRNTDEITMPECILINTEEAK